MNAIGYLSGMLLNVIEKRSFEERLAALEAVIGSGSSLQHAAFPEESSFEFVQENAADSSDPDDQAQTIDSN